MDIENSTPVDKQLAFDYAFVKIDRDVAKDCGIGNRYLMLVLGDEPRPLGSQHTPTQLARYLLKHLGEQFDQAIISYGCDLDEISYNGFLIPIETPNSSEMRRFQRELARTFPLAD